MLRNKMLYRNKISSKSHCLLKLPSYIQFIQKSMFIYFVRIKTRANLKNFATFIAIEFENLFLYTHIHK